MLLSLLSPGCANRYHVTDPSREVLRIRKSQPIPAPVDGWFVPDATWREINEALTDRVIP